MSIPDVLSRMRRDRGILQFSEALNLSSEGSGLRLLAGNDPAVQRTVVEPGAGLGLFGLALRGVENIQYVGIDLFASSSDPNGIIPADFLQLPQIVGGRKADVAVCLASLGTYAPNAEVLSQHIRALRDTMKQDARVYMSLYPAFGYFYPENQGVQALLNEAVHRDEFIIENPFSHIQKPGNLWSSFEAPVLSMLNAGGFALSGAWVPANGAEMPGYIMVSLMAGV